MYGKLRERARDQGGFTLIELLVVVLIVAILAAIALPAFLNQRGKAQDTDAKSAARTAQTAMETWYTSERDYSATAVDLREIEPALNEGAAGRSLAVTPGAVGVPTDGYTVAATSETGNTFAITKASVANGGNVTRTCVTAKNYGCPKTGRW